MLAVEKAIKISGWIYEFEEEELSTKEMMERQETGHFLPIDVITDCNSLYDSILGEMFPKPTDETNLLRLQYLRECYQRKNLRSLSWCSTSDQMADGLTKVDDTASASLQDLMMKGDLRLGYSYLCNGVIKDAWKGLPPPKRKRHECSQHFVSLLLESSAALFGRRT